MHVNELKSKNPLQLLKLAEDMGIENPSQLDVKQMRFAVLRVMAGDKKNVLIGDGVLERMQDGFGFLRAPESNYLAGPDDLYVSPALIKKYGLKTGDYVEGKIEAPRNDQERYFALETIEKVNGADPEKLKHRARFDDMTPLYPDSMLKMEVDDDTQKGRAMSARVIDMISPTGKGQRSLIVAPPRTGKTVMLQNIAHSVATNYPKAKLIVLLVDERPEEVTDMKRSVKGEVVSSTFDEPAARHIQVAEMVIEKAKRYIQWVNPGITADKVFDIRVFRYEYAQPLATTGFLEKLPPIKSEKRRGFYFADTAYCYPEDRSIQESVRIAKEIVRYATE